MLQNTESMQICKWGNVQQLSKERNCILFDEKQVLNL